MKITRPHFEIDETVTPTDDAAIKPASRFGRVESRSWVEEANRAGRSVAGEEAAKALNHLIIARQHCVDPAELARINKAITALMEATRYRKKPVSIEAVQLDPDNVTDVLDWITENGGEAILLDERNNRGVLLVHTLEGDHYAQTGDWVIRGVAGEFYPCKPEIFTQTYEPVDSPGNGGVAPELHKAADEGMGI